MEFMLTKEVGVMIDMLEKAGYKVVVASASGQLITGRRHKPEAGLVKVADVKVDDYAGFVFPCMAVDMDLPPPPEAVEDCEGSRGPGKAGGRSGRRCGNLGLRRDVERQAICLPGRSRGIYARRHLQRHRCGSRWEYHHFWDMSLHGEGDGQGRTELFELTQKFIDLLAATRRGYARRAATSDQLKVVQAYHAAVNSGDVDAALALLTDDVKFRGEYYGTGKEALPWVFDWLVGQETQWTPDCQIAKRARRMLLHH